MKKRICWMLSLLLAVSCFPMVGNAEANPETTTYSDVTVIMPQLPPENGKEDVNYETVTDTVIAGPYAVANELILNRGDEVTIVGETEKYYEIQNSEKNVFVNKSYIRTSGEPAAERTVYAKSSAVVYKTAEFNKSEIALTASLNTAFTVHDELNGIMYVSWGDGNDQHGYVSADSTNTSAVSDWGGGWDGGWDGGGGDSGYGGEGGDIFVDELLDNWVSTAKSSIATFMIAALPHVHAAELPATKSGVCFSDGIHTYSAIIDRNDVVNVLVEQPEEQKTIVLTIFDKQRNGTVKEISLETPAVKAVINGYLCDVPSALLLSSQSPDFEAYDAYIQNDVTWHNCFDLNDEGKSVAVNTAVSVVASVGDVMVVESSEKDTIAVHYVLSGQVSVYQYENTWNDWGSWDGGGGGDAMEWGPDVM